MSFSLVQDVNSTNTGAFTSTKIPILTFFWFPCATRRMLTCRSLYPRRPPTTSTSSAARSAATSASRSSASRPSPSSGVRSVLALLVHKYLLYWYKVLALLVQKYFRKPLICISPESLRRCAQCACFTGTQVLALLVLVYYTHVLALLVHKYLLYWYKSTCSIRSSASRSSPYSVHKYKY